MAENSRTTTQGGTVTAIEPSLVQRVTQGVRFVLSGKSGSDFFGPGQPLQPQAQEQARGRQFDYNFAANTRLRPRDGESVTFDQLRALADGYDLLRLVIQTRKDQMCAQSWTVKPVDKDAPRTPRCDEIEAFLKRPDREHTWNSWLRMLLEDLFVIDAPTIYPRLTKGGQLYALELIDGATIKRVIDGSGRTPMAPDPAYQQVLKGLPAVDYSQDELIYAPQNPRTSRLYGYSPVEQVIMTVGIAIRRQLHQLEFYTSGSVPDMMVAVPETWNPDQISQFQQWWDDMLSGNSSAKRRARFIPGGMTPVMTKDAALKDGYDEWLARIVCYAFSVPPTPFVAQVNRSTAGSAQEAAMEEGLAPLMLWVEDLMTDIIARYFNAPDLCFDWKQEKETDPMVQASVAKLYVDAGVLHPDEIREDLGREPLTPEQKADLAPPPPPMALPGAAHGEPGLPADTAKVQKKKDASSTLTEIGQRLQNHGPRSPRY